MAGLPEVKAWARQQGIRTLQQAVANLRDNLIDAMRPADGDAQAQSR